MRGLASRGVAVSIDDFGTGYTSLGLLRQLPVHELKIDKSFVMGMAQGARSRGEAPGEDTAIVRSTADLAHNLGLNVVAEGVENQWTLDLLGTLRLRPGAGLPHRAADAGGGVRRLAGRVVLEGARELSRAAPLLRDRLVLVVAGVRLLLLGQAAHRLADEGLVEHLLVAQLLEELPHLGIGEVGDAPGRRTRGPSSPTRGPPASPGAPT